jgi:hypothetical protein
MRTALVGSALLALLALAAIGSAGDRWGGGAEQRGFPSALVDYSFTILVLLFVGLIVLIVDALRDRKGRPALPQRTGINPWISFLFFIAVLSGYAAFTNADFTRPGDDEGGEGGAQRRPGRATSGGGGEEQGVDFQWWLALTVALLVVAYLLYLRTRRRAVAATAGDELEAILTDTLDELELDPDPRRAVIQAYVRMEAVLAAHGHGRLPHEAPLEYLARVLRELDVRAEAAHALTELFERARFSTHEIDAAMRAEAVSSLEAVRDDLRAAA